MHPHRHDRAINGRRVRSTRSRTDRTQKMILTADPGRLTRLSAADPASTVDLGRTRLGQRGGKGPHQQLDKVPQLPVARERPSIKTGWWCRMLRMTKTENLPDG